MYPILGGVAASHKLNGLNPVDTNAAYRITYTGTITHSVSGMTGNAVNGYGNTNFNTPGYTYKNNFSFGVYVNSSGSTSGVIMGQTLGQAQYYMAIGTPNMTLSIDNPNYLGNKTFPLTGTTTGFFAGSKTGTTNTICHQNGLFSINTQSSVESFGNAVPMLLFAVSEGGGAPVGNYSNSTLAFAYLSSGLTTTELSTFRNIVQTFQTSCGRNV